MIELYMNIKKRRIELGLTQTELAKRLGYADKSMIAKIEKGNIDLPQSKIEAFAEALHTTPSQLMGWTDDTESETEQGYYLNPETADIAQQIHDNKEMRALFSAARDASPEDLETTYNVLLALKRKERGADE